ncbi:MAG: RNA polymerase sigma factor [Saprospiraceae bacterium]
MKQATEWTDDKLKSAILGNVAQREAAFSYLYQQSNWREWVIAHVLKEGGDKQDGADVYQESVILLDRNIRQGRYEGGSTLRTYFYGIAKWGWFNLLRTRRRIVSIPEIPELAGVDMETLILEEERKRAISWIILQLSETCRKVLPLYMLSHTNAEIAQELDLSSPEMAKKYIHRCREQFRKFVMQQEWLRKLLNINNPGDEK